MKESIRQLIKVLNKTREFLLRPENDFAWSDWDDSQDALEELDTLISRLEKKNLPNKLELSVLFAPTGPVQEVSVSSGWGDEFLILANEFDAALAEVYL
jgi:hypothetical protein